jgi:hypothetical protein
MKKWFTACLLFVSGIEGSGTAQITGANGSEMPSFVTEVVGACPDGSTREAGKRCICEGKKFMTHENNCVDVCDYSKGFLPSADGRCECPKTHENVDGWCVNWENRNENAQCLEGFYDIDGICKRPRVGFWLPVVCDRKDLVTYNALNNSCVCIENAEAVSKDDTKCKCISTHFDMNSVCVPKIDTSGFVRVQKNKYVNFKIGAFDVLGEMYCGYNDDEIETVLLFSGQARGHARVRFGDDIMNVPNITSMFDISAAADSITLTPTSNGNGNQFTLYKNFCSK